MAVWQEIVDYTWTATETSRAFTGLSITKDDFIKIVVTRVYNTSSDSYLALFANDNTTLSQYRVQMLFGTASTVSALRQTNSNYILYNDNVNGSVSTAIAYVKLSENGHFNMFSNIARNIDSNIALNYFYTTSGNTFTSIDTLTVSGPTNSIASGSRIQIYKLAAEKVADITVASNTTQVDISNLSIDKDSEYLLMYDCLPTLNGFDLYVNDNITSTNYYQQTIFANGTSVGAGRSNEARIDDSTVFIGYAHIKLSNIGAYTYQSYTLRGYGTNSPLVINRFGSSTAENITSITKLNLKANDTNGILANSRFMLYKLY